MLAPSERPEPCTLRGGTDIHRSFEQAGCGLGPTHAVPTSPDTRSFHPRWRVGRNGSSDGPGKPRCRDDRKPTRRLLGEEGVRVDAVRAASKTFRSHDAAVRWRGADSGPRRVTTPLADGVPEAFSGRAVPIDAGEMMVFAEPG